MLGDASSALEMKEMEGALKATQSHLLNHFLAQALGQRNQIMALEGEEERSECSWVSLSRGWSATNEGGEGGINTPPQNEP
jgi:hypothetical protein